jgi:hypothetical protein
MAGSNTNNDHKSSDKPPSLESVRLSSGLNTCCNASTSAVCAVSFLQMVNEHGITQKLDIPRCEKHVSLLHLNKELA